jgi:hypothetical protein
MATKKKAPAAAVNVDGDAILNAAADADANNKRLSVVDAQFGDSLPYDKTRIENEARFFLTESASAMLEAGKRIVLLKEHEQHGEFMGALERIGIAPRAAQKLMQAAVKFSGKPQVAALGKAKMLELISEDDEQLAGLEEGGTIAGHTIDEIDRMSSSELRAALRKARDARQHDAEVHEKLVAQKDRKINELHKKVHEREKRTKEWPFRVREIQIETTELAAAMLEEADRLDVMRDAILTEQFGDEDHEPAIEAMAVVYYDALTQVMNRVIDMWQACDEVFSGYKAKARPMLDVQLPEASE